MGSFEMNIEPQTAKVYDREKDKKVIIDKLIIIDRVQKKLAKALKQGIVRNIKEVWNKKTLTITWETLDTATNTWC